MAKFRFKSDRTKYGKRHKPGEMNKTEASYAEILESRRLRGEILAWEFEAVTFKLAGGVRYTPDFLVSVGNEEIELVDVKGGGPIDAKSVVKIKCAAEKFWQFTFVIEQKSKSGVWVRTEY